MDQNKTPINFYLELSKAFLSQDIRLSKLQHYGVWVLDLNLIKIVLEDHTQFVQFDESISEIKFIHKGVPQGPTRYHIWTFLFWSI